MLLMCGTKVVLLIVSASLLTTVSGAILNNSDPSTCSFNNQLYSSEGTLRIALIVNECFNTTVSSTYTNSAKWTVDRVNSLGIINPLSVGLTIFQACTESDYYDSIYKLFKQDGESYSLGALSSSPVSAKVRLLSEVLGVPLSPTDKYRSGLVEATVKLLSALDLVENITVYSDSRIVLQEFYKLTRQELMCIKSAVILDGKHSTRFVKHENGPVVVFGGHGTIKAFTRNSSMDAKMMDAQMVFAPLDGCDNNDFPEGSYVIQPTFSENELELINSTKLIPSPLLFDIANPILNIALNISDFMTQNCNETLYKLNCLRKKYSKIGHYHLKFLPTQILQLLKIESLADTFLYKIYRVENLTLLRQETNTTTDEQNQRNYIFQSFVNVFTYNMFNGTLIDLEENPDFESNESVAVPRLFRNCTSECINFAPSPSPKTILISYAFNRFGLRSESWVFAFLSTSILGVAFCIAVLTFLTVRFCKRDILEGNPFLTILLLLAVVLMYCSVVPFTLESDKELKYYICLARALSTTLTYAFAFSLLLSRSILLATVSKEVGFMSHVPGPVQSFLTLFIFGVQGALSLQFFNHCEDIFRGISFVYLMSYNIILLILLVFICPLNIRTHRNYREGKHFTVAVVLMACAWSCWIPCYAVLDEDWRDPILCLGLVSTASILLGSIFIPRTYIMTVAAARDRLTNALPSLPATSSIMDVYRASTQPIYDCINIAAITARSIPPPPPPQPEIYSSLPVPYDDEFDFERSITPTPDKVTRF